MASFMTRVKDKIIARYKFDVNQVVKEYDTFLQYALVTTSSFQDILDGKLNQRRRIFQLTMMLYYCLYMIPRYCFVSQLYFRDEQTQKHYQYILADYAEEMGILGRAFNVGYLTFTIGMFVNDIVLRNFEGQGSLEFLTDWLKRVPKKPRIEDENRDEITAAGELDNESKHKLISGLYYKLIFAKIMVRTTVTAAQSFDLIAFPLFIYKRKPSFFITCLGFWNWVTILICIEICGHHCYSLFLSYVMTSDYFKLVLNNIIRKVEELKTKGFTNRNLTPILDDYDFMMTDFKKYNRVLKFLIRTLVYFYIFALTVCFFQLTVKTETWLFATSVGGAGAIAFSMLATGVYLSQLHAKVTKLHNSLVSLSVTHGGNKRERLSLNYMFRLKHVIQELGSLETDGQFVIGLRDGEGPAISRMEIFNLTMETVSNTLMIHRFVNGMYNL